MKINDLSYNATGARYGYNSQEQSTEIDVNGNHTTAEFWEYDARSARRWNLDPKPVVGISSYATFQSNPIMFSDPFGDSTYVSDNGNGIYKVENGSFDNDNGIYLINNGIVGKQIGYSATPESFWNSDEGRWMGEINTKDMSGINFLKNQILKDDPNIIYYMANAKGGELYDFKRTNGTENVIYNNDEDGTEYYRGMPIDLYGKNSSLPVFASARDFGNMAAGIVAGRGGLSWETARSGFDFLETYKSEGSLTALESIFCSDKRVIESSSSQFAQLLGWRIGRQTRAVDIDVENCEKSCSKVSKSILKRSATKNYIK